MNTGTAITAAADVSTAATKADLRRALALLSSLPSQVAASPDLQLEATWIAIDGVTRHALSEAVKAILRGQLGRGFFPSPAELRKACDAAQQVVDHATENARLSEELERNRELFERRKRQFEASREARVAANLARLREKQADWDSYAAHVSAMSQRRMNAGEAVESARKIIGDLQDG